MFPQHLCEPAKLTIFECVCCAFTVAGWVLPFTVQCPAALCQALYGSGCTPMTTIGNQSHSLRACNQVCELVSISCIIGQASPTYVLILSFFIDCLAWILPLSCHALRVIITDVNPISSSVSISTMLLSPGMFPVVWRGNSSQCNQKSYEIRYCCSP